MLTKIPNVVQISQFLFSTDVDKIHYAMSDNAKKIQDNVPDIDNAGLYKTIETIQKTI